MEAGNKVFEPREKKGAGGKSLVGLWATRAEQQEVKKMAIAGGHSSVADYFRCLIREDRARCMQDPVPRGGFRIEVSTPFGVLKPQTVAASDLVDALASAGAIPLEQWFPEDEPDGS